MRSLRLLNLRRLRRQPLRATIAIVAVGAGVSLVVSIVVLTSSLSQSLEDFGRRLAGPAPLRVIGPTTRGGLPEDVPAKVASTPGVKTSLPVVQAVTYAVRPDGDRTIVLAIGSPLTQETTTSNSLARHLGTGAALRTELGRVPFRAKPVAGLDSLNGGRVVLLPLGEAQRLFARGHRVDVIYISPVSGTSVPALKARLARTVGPWNGVLDSTEPPPVAQVASDIFIPLFGLLSLFALGIGAVLVYNTLSLSLEERRRELAIVAAVGGTPRALAAGALAEAALLGVAGGIAGTFGGMLLARPLAHSLSDFTEKVIGARITVHAGPAAFVIGAVLGAVIAVAASWVPVRRATRMDVAAELGNRELRSESAPKLALTRGLVFTGIGFAGLAIAWVGQRHGALEPWQATVAPLGVLVTALGFLLAVGAFAGIVAHVCLGAATRSTAPVRLGLANLVREPRRTGVMAIAVGSAVGIAFNVASANRSIRDGVTSNIIAHSRGDVNVSTLAPNNTVNIDAKMPPSLLAALARVPGVASISGGVDIETGHSKGTLVGVSASNRRDLYFDFPIIEGSKDPARFERGDVLIGPALARTRHLRPGSMLQLETPTGYARVPVMAVWQNGNFNGRGVYMALSVFNRLYGAQPLDFVHMKPVPGVNDVELARRIKAAGLDPDLRVETASEFAHELSGDIGQQLAPFWALQRGLLLVSFIAVLSTLLLVGVQRRRELGLLAAVGMRPSELSRMVMAEAGVIGLIGAVLGAIGSVGMYVAFHLIVPVVIGFSDPLRFDVGAVGVYGPVAIVVVLLAAAWPAWRTSRVEVLEALQYE